MSEKYQTKQKKKKKSKKMKKSKKIAKEFVIEIPKKY